MRWERGQLTALVSEHSTSPSRDVEGWLERATIDLGSHDPSLLELIRWPASQPHPHCIPAGRPPSHSIKHQPSLRWLKESKKEHTQGHTSQPESQSLTATRRRRIRGDRTIRISDCIDGRTAGNEPAGLALCHLRICHSRLSPGNIKTPTARLLSSLERHLVLHAPLSPLPQSTGAWPCVWQCWLWCFFHLCRPALRDDLLACFFAPLLSLLGHGSVPNKKKKRTLLGPTSFLRTCSCLIALFLHKVRDTVPTYIRIQLRARLHSRYIISVRLCLLWRLALSRKGCRRGASEILHPSHPPCLFVRHLRHRQSPPNPRNTTSKDWRAVATTGSKLSPALIVPPLSRSSCRAATGGRVSSSCRRIYAVAQSRSCSAAVVHCHSSSQPQLPRCSRTASRSPTNCSPNRPLQATISIFIRSLATATTTRITKRKSKPVTNVPPLTSEAMEFDRVLYTPIVDRILKAGDLASISSKDVRKSLQKELGYDITDQKAEITALIRERFDLILEATGPENVQPVKQESTNGYDADVKKEDPGATPSKKRKSVASPSSLENDARLAAKMQAEWNSQDRPSRSTAAKRKVVAPRKKKKSSATISDESGEEGGEKKKKRKINANNPFHQPLILSPQLSTLLGETQLSRPETVKRIWAYIKERNLQDENDKRYIVCDENLRTVFPTAKVHMFTMNKILSGHLYPMKKSDAAEVKNEDIKSEDFASSPISAAFSHQGSPPSSIESEAS